MAHAVFHISYTADLYMTPIVPSTCLEWLLQEIGEIFYEHTGERDFSLKLGGSNLNLLQVSILLSPDLYWLEKKQPEWLKEELEPCVALALAQDFFGLKASPLQLTVEMGLVSS